MQNCLKRRCLISQRSENFFLIQSITISFLACLFHFFFTETTEPIWLKLYIDLRYDNVQQTKCYGIRFVHSYGINNDLIRISYYNTTFTLEV